MILFYAAENSRVVESLNAMLTGLRVKQCRSVETLANCLRKPCHGQEIGLMVVNTLEEMNQIGRLQNLFRNLRLILVLPGRDPKMVVQAHKLSPRFIAYADNGMEQISAVLSKMVGAKRQKRIGQDVPMAQTQA